MAGRQCRHPARHHQSGRQTKGGIYTSSNRTTDPRDGGSTSSQPPHVGGKIYESLLKYGLI